MGESERSFKPGRYRTGDAELDEAVVELLDKINNDSDPDLLFEMLVSAVRLGNTETSRGDLKLLNSTLKELRYAIESFEPYSDHRKVSIFGSARTPKGSAEYELAHKFASDMTKQDWMVITGAGPGIMTAGIEGAGAENSFGVNILLPFESGSASALDGDPKLINFKYFFTRKLMFMKESHGYALFPGGFGTMDETFELLTLMQTGRTYLAPVVMLDADSTYWETWSHLVANELGARGLISSADVGLARICHTSEEAVAEICAFYRNYHSMRFVGSSLIMRLNVELPQNEIRELNREFADIVASGRIASVVPTNAERADAELLESPRLSFEFNQRSYGRLRLLIDRINHHEPSDEFPG